MYRAEKFLCPIVLFFLQRILIAVFAKADMVSSTFVAFILCYSERKIPRFGLRCLYKKCNRGSQRAHPITHSAHCVSYDKSPAATAISDYDWSDSLCGCCRYCSSCLPRRLHHRPALRPKCRQTSYQSPTRCERHRIGNRRYCLFHILLALVDAVCESLHKVWHWYWHSTVIPLILPAIRYHLLIRV